MSLPEISDDRLGSLIGIKKYVNSLEFFYRSRWATLKSGGAIRVMEPRDIVKLMDQFDKKLRQLSTIRHRLSMALASAWLLSNISGLDEDGKEAKLSNIFSEFLRIDEDTLKVLADREMDEVDRQFKGIRHIKLQKRNLMRSKEFENRYGDVRRFVGAVFGAGDGLRKLSEPRLALYDMPGIRREYDIAFALRLEQLEGLLNTSGFIKDDRVVFITSAFQGGERAYPPDSFPPLYGAGFYKRGDEYIYFNSDVGEIVCDSIGELAAAIFHRGNTENPNDPFEPLPLGFDVFSGLRTEYQPKQYPKRIKIFNAIGVNSEYVKENEMRYVKKTGRFTSLMGDRSRLAYTGLAMAAVIDSPKTVKNFVRIMDDDDVNYPVAGDISSYMHAVMHGSYRAAKEFAKRYSLIPPLVQQRSAWVSNPWKRFKAGLFLFTGLLAIPFSLVPPVNLVFLVIGASLSIIGLGEMERIGAFGGVSKKWNRLFNFLKDDNQELLEREEEEQLGKDIKAVLSEASAPKLDEDVVRRHVRYGDATPRASEPSVSKPVVTVEVDEDVEEPIPGRHYFK